MMESVNVDWSDSNIFDQWDFVGAHLVGQRERERLSECPHDVDHYCDECNIYPEDRENAEYPMMNCAYPLYMRDVSDEKILEICKRTNLTVVYNTQDGEYYMALTGGGMDLSQDIALAYHIANGGYVPMHMLDHVNPQPMLSVGKEDWLTIADDIINGLENSIARLQSKKKQWEKSKAEVMAE